MELSGQAWAGFTCFLLLMLALDLGVFHRRSHVVTFREAVSWSIVWIGLSLGFAWLLQIKSGSGPAMEFLTAYVIEKSLSIDNVFVFAMLFSAMRVPRECEHKVLFWGVFGALLMRVVMIFAGVRLLESFHWLIYVFGGILIVAAVRMLMANGSGRPISEHFVVRCFIRMFGITKDFRGDRFFVREDGRLRATPLFLTLLLVEWSDLVFAVDSIPAVLAVSKDSFIVFTSNAFAILGLRSLYFALAGMMEKFCYLKYGLAGILGFVGTKMLLVDVAPVPIGLSLSIILVIGIGSVVASLLKNEETAAASFD